jgi:hypothetical protein
LHPLRLACGICIHFSFMLHLTTSGSKTHNLI